MRGEGEWQVRKQGASRMRQWRKVHLAMDTATGDVCAVEFTSSGEGDSPMLPELLAQFPPDPPIGTVTADGAYDTRTCHSAIAERGATAFVGAPIPRIGSWPSSLPIRKNGRPWKEDCSAAKAGNELLRGTRHFGRTFWKRWTGYHARSREGPDAPPQSPRPSASPHTTPDHQTAELHTRITPMNRFEARGRPRSRASPEPKGKDRTRPNPSWATTSCAVKNGAG
jgi:hypothetical protein